MQTNPTSLFTNDQIQSGAEFSECRQYRYALWRKWDSTKPCVMFVGLNPSTADETYNDPTIRRCIGFAQSWDFGGLYMLNLYAFRATDPYEMVLRRGNAIGPSNDEAFGYYRSRVQLIVAAWGALSKNWRGMVSWDTRVARTLAELARPVKCLGKTKDGSPKHPLYLKATTELESFWEPKANT